MEIEGKANYNWLRINGGNPATTPSLRTLGCGDWKPGPGHKYPDVPRQIAAGALKSAPAVKNFRGKTCAWLALQRFR
jgi:hypothetical protein